MAHATIGVMVVMMAMAQAPLQELAPTGRLRVAIGVGAANSAFWASRDPATGRPRGVTVDLAEALSGKLGVPLELVIYTNSGDVTDAGPNGEWDVTFLPQDDGARASSRAIFTRRRWRPRSPRDTGRRSPT